MFSGRILLPLLFVALAAAQEQLPTAETILDRYVEVTGGREAYQNLKSEVRTTSVEIKGQDLRFTATTYRARPNEAYSATEIPGVGKVEEGVDGDLAWTLTAAAGPALKEGVERDFAMYGARLDAELNWRDWHPKAVLAGTEEFEGRTCYKLLLTDKEGEQHTRLYDKETGFLVQVALQVKLPQGQFLMEMRYYDYRPAGGGLLVAHRALRIMPGREMESRLEKINVNVEIDPVRFAPPEPVKALVAKQKSGN